MASMGELAWNRTPVTVMPFLAQPHPIRDHLSHLICGAASGELISEGKG